ncbi:MAG TPA: non-canonical purine NTP diphosphatase [Bacteroidetes bacterium]|nr:non-canonical purine NTP diphosphatase [Candidatus Limimorpha avicola]
MKKLVFATHNAHKLQEIKALLKNLEVISLTDIGCKEEIEETAETLEGNAKIKANYVTEHYHLDCFADDTGLEVEALNGAPGVYSARYAGENCSYQDNVNKLLSAMEGIENRKARFRTVIALNLEGHQYYFEGIVNGTIIKEGHGTGGFGYDPIFKPEGYEQTFAEMPLELKNRISHRGLAIAKLIDFFATYK